MQPSVHSRARLVRVLFGLAALGGVVGAYAALDRVLTVYPVLAGDAIALGFAVIALCIGLDFLHAVPMRWRWSISLAACAAILVLRAADTNTRKPFLRDLGRIQLGMTLAEVDTIMERYERSPSVPGRLSEQSTASFRHTTEWWGNSDIGLVRFHDGRVAKVEFVPD